jgi:hypothetical protein
MISKRMPIRMTIRRSTTEMKGETASKNPLVAPLTKNVTTKVETAMSQILWYP